MNPDSSEDQARHPFWDQLVALFRGQRDSEASRDTSAPLGFATRVVSRWQEMRQNEMIRRWERFSIRTAVASCACAAVVGLFVMVNDQGMDEEEELLLLPPTELETFTGLE